MRFSCVAAAVDRNGCLFDRSYAKVFEMRHALIVCFAFAMCFGGVGCRRPETSPVVESGEPEVSIVAEQTPSDEHQQQMLAAKDALQMRLSGRLMEAMAQGPASAIRVCNQEAPQIASSVGEEHGVRIGRVGVRLRNPNNTPPPWAKGLTDSNVNVPTFVTLSDGHDAAWLPIKLQTQCLMCHGPTDQIAPVIKDQLARLYPNDRATGFAEGELRGWFWVELL
ncbi:cytochrome c family protein [Rhodopirellula sallentina SM41]|uniref:Cytochrome c family protein n=2 Tax=Rhodopirellula TaxID=265488 RepID=M5U3F8_9BACT|nr:cytochrome c family protein [Rhodopirellula sallentina SM41]